MTNGSQQWMGLHGAVKNTEQEMFTKMRYTASTVDSNYHMEVHLPPFSMDTITVQTQFHQRNSVCTVMASMLKGPVSADTDEMDPVHLSTHVKKSRTVTVVDTRVQHGFQLCCDPA